MIAPNYWFAGAAVIGGDLAVLLGNRGSDTFCVVAYDGACSPVTFAERRPGYDAATRTIKVANVIAVPSPWDLARRAA